MASFAYLCYFARKDKLLDLVLCSIRYLFRAGRIMILRNSCCLPASKGKQLFLVMFLVSVLMIIQVSVLSAAPAMYPAHASVQKQAKKNGSNSIEFEAGFGYRQDSFDWNIAGDLQGDNPNVLSELKWRNLDIHEAYVGFRANLKDTFVFKGSVSYGVIVSGDNRDSDYSADNREMEFSRSINDAGDGNTFDGQLGVGYRFRIISDAIDVIPMAGYSYHRQYLTMTDGYQDVTWLGGPPLGPFDGLDSSYDARWQGPWIGIEMTLDAERLTRSLTPLSFFAAWEYHWADYSAEADWNLREDLKHPTSFVHEADGTGTVASLGVCVRLDDRWSLTLEYETEEWSTERGVDRVFLDNDTILETRLNEVNWNSEVFYFGCSVRF
jgi:hypothetical protein